MKLQLVLSGATEPSLVRTGFGEEAPAHEWIRRPRHKRGVDAFAAAALHHKLTAMPLGDPGVVHALAEVCKEMRKRRPYLKWPVEMLDGPGVWLQLLETTGNGAGPTAAISSALLKPEDIEVMLDDQSVSHDRRLLERLLAGLLAVCAPEGGVPCPPPRSDAELIRELRALAPSAGRVAFVIATSELEVPRRAAATLLAYIAAFRSQAADRRLRIGLSGGLLQQFVLRELEKQARGLRPGKTQVVATNGMRYADARADRSAGNLARALARRISSELDVTLPPALPHPDAVRAHRDAVTACDLLLLSAGSAHASYIKEALQLFGLALPPPAVGDLAGHLITADGHDASTPRTREILAPLHCEPPTDTLRRLAAGRARVMLVADAIPGDQTRPTAKARVVRAALLGGLANQVVMSRRLAEQVLREAS